jgi:copper chaperone CopZ
MEDNVMPRFQIPRKLSTIAVVAISLSQLSNAATSLAAQAAAEKVQIVASGMCCKGCAQKVAAQLYAAPGVSNVEADLPSRTVTVTFKPSPKLTLSGLWQATEKADGKPTKLVTPRATYTLQRPEQLQLAQPLAPGRYWVVLNNPSSSVSIQEISKRLYSVRGVKTVSFDAPNRTFFVESATAEPLSPWNLVAAVEQAGQNAASITGPHGVFTIEHPAETAVRTNQSQQQGAVR